MRFSFIDAKRAEFPVAHLCEALEVSQSGYFAWKNRPASQRQRKDMVLLAISVNAFGFRKRPAEPAHACRSH